MSRHRLLPHLLVQRAADSPELAFIQVVDTPFARKSDTTGRVTLRGLPASVNQVRVYHPMLRAPGNQMTVAVDAARDATVPVTVRLRRPAPRHHDY